MGNSGGRQYTNQKDVEEKLGIEKLWGIALTSSWEFRRLHACSGLSIGSEKTWADPQWPVWLTFKHYWIRLKQSCKLADGNRCAPAQTLVAETTFLFLLPVPVISVTKFSKPFPWPNFLSAMAAQFPSLSTHTGRCKVSDKGVLRSTEFHSWISLVECSTIPSRGFTRPPVEIPELHHKHKER